jgi:uncharacterized protein (DUF885 family)
LVVSESERDRARDVADRYWDELLEEQPLFATQIGDERFDDRLPDPSEAGLERRAELQRRALAEIQAIGTAGLDQTLRTTLDVLEASAIRDLAAIEQRIDRLEAVTHFWGPAQLLVELGTTQQADTPERLDRYLARLRAVPAFLAAICEVAADGVRAGVTVPRVVAERTLGQLERLLALPVEQSPALFALAEDDPDGRERVIEVLRRDTMPGHEVYLAAIRDYLPYATESIGLSELPNGAAMYAAQILAWTTLPLKAPEIHELGLETLEKIHEERREVAKRLGFSSPEEVLAAAADRGDNVATTREELVRIAQDQVDRSWAAAPAYFGRLPSRICDVRPVEEFRESDMPFAWYQPPSKDGTRAGIYYLNAYDLPNRPLHHMAATTYHEANPGHHFQLTLEQEMEDRPALRRFGGMLGGSAFIEGWGLYSERLADEMGLYTNELERLGMLDAQAHRSARLVVDTGIHAFGWGRERAIESLESAGVPTTDAEIETDRYITMPGQALSYKIGQLEIQRWRREAEAREGGAFSLKHFHDRLLALGSLPLASLERELAT